MDSLPQSWLVTLDRIKYHAQDALSAVTSCLWQQDQKVKINGRTCTLSPSGAVHSVPDVVQCIVKILRVLGEGGFSFVYLAQDEASQVRP